MQNHNVVASSSGIATRYNYTHTAWMTTLIVYAPATDSYQQRWEPAVNELRLLLARSGFNTGRWSDDIAIEIIDPVLEQRWFVDPVERSHPAAANWERIANEIVFPAVARLEQTVMHDIRAINLIRYGVLAPG